MSRDPRSEESRALILEVARRHFAERGYPGASVQRIADDAGVSKALVFFHFSSKQGLFDDVIRSFVDRCIAELSDLEIDTATPVSQIESLVDAVRRFSVEQVDFARLVLSTFLREEPEPDSAPSKVLVFLGHCQRMFAHALRLGGEQGVFRDDLDLEVTSRSILASLLGLFVLARMDGAVSDRFDEVYAEHTRALLASLTPTGRS